MSFIVRTVARTADGREIVRPRTFAQKEISIGRDAASDIHLPDLAVDLRHAMIREAGPGRIEITTAGLPMDVNGRTTVSETVDVARGANIRIGSHLLTVSAGEGESAGDTVIAVERVGAGVDLLRDLVAQRQAVDGAAGCEADGVVLGHGDLVVFIAGSAFGQAEFHRDGRERLAEVVELDVEPAGFDRQPGNVDFGLTRESAGEAGPARVEQGAGVRRVVAAHPVRDPGRP